MSSVQPPVKRDGRRGTSLQSPVAATPRPPERDRLRPPTADRIDSITNAPLRSRPRLDHSSAPPPTPSANTDPAAAVPRPSAFQPASPPSPAPPRKKRDTPSGRDAEISSGFTKPIKTPADSRPEVNKTLKCPECGTANYPTEWYCERCGGELATM